MIRTPSRCVTDDDHEYHELYADARVCRWCGKTDQLVIGYPASGPPLRREPFWITDDEIERWVRHDRVAELRKQRRQSVWSTVICWIAAGFSAVAATSTLWFVPSLVVFLWIARREAAKRDRLLGEIACLIGPPARAYLVGQTDGVRSSHVGQDSS